MKFNSASNKLKILADNNKELKNKLNFKISEDARFKFQTEINIPNNFLFNKSIDFSTDWETIESISDSSYYTKHKVWVINWELFDIRMLPHMSIECLYRVKGSNTADTLSQNPYFHKYFHISDIGDSDNYKKVKLIASLYVSKYSEQYEYEGKLNIFLTNPREYR